jgi:hypothetical protein
MADDGLDAETLSYVKFSVAREYELPETMAHRLRGATLAQLREDAVAARRELGMPALDAPDRDKWGRFAGRSAEPIDLNAQIRKAVGR